MEKLSISAYWAGVVSTVLALVTRGLAMLGIYAMPTAQPGVAKVPISSRTFLEGAILFFVMAIAGHVIASAKTQRS